MANKVVSLATEINTSFYDFVISQKTLIKHSIFKSETEDTEKIKGLNDVCSKLEINYLDLNLLKSKSNFINISISDYFSFKRQEDNKLIYKIEKYNGDFHISTGIYCGIVNFGGKFPQLTIKTCYSDHFFRRMLNFCCGFYADNQVTDSVSKNKSIYSLLVQYLFLISLRKVILKTIPKKYVKKMERGYNIKGNVDINSYVNHDIISFDKKITYEYSEQLEIQSIIDVLFTALKHCIMNDKSYLPDLTKYKNYLNQLYSGRKPSKQLIHNVTKEKVLSNGLYSDFKRPLEYAQILLSNEELNFGETKSNSGVSGFLVDASFLWEMYLYNLMKIHLDDWDIESQCELSFYDSTFFTKKNYPDFVLKNKSTGNIFILDAKFKKMEYRNCDVDNEDMRQLHSYSYYFHLKDSSKFKGCALIYPTKKDQPSDDIKQAPMFGNPASDKSFSILTVKDPGDNGSIIDSENSFIKELKKMIEIE